MKEYIDGGEATLEAFRAIGVDYVFSSPGSEWAPVWEAVTRQQMEARPGPQYLDLWHETVAVGMATGYTLVTGRLQAVLLHAGAGLLQGANAVHGALLTGVPMLVLSSESVTYGERAGVDPGSQWYRNLSVVGGPHTMAAPFVKWANQAPSIETLYEMLLRTAELGMRSPAGPVYLNVPVETLLEPWTTPPRPGHLPAPGAKHTPAEEIAEVAALLREAREPVVVTETAGRDPAAFAGLVRLCEQAGIPVVEPQSAVCANFPRTHPLHAGGDITPFLDTADLVLLVNCRAPWYPPGRGPARAKVVVLDEVPQRPHIVYQVLHADSYLEGDVACSLEDLADALAAMGGVDPRVLEERTTRYTRQHAARLATSREAEQKAASAELIEPVLLAARLREQLPADSLVIDETITHSRVLQEHLQVDEASRYFYVQGGLGQGIGVALGAKLADRDRTVVFTVGDGAFLYNPVPAALSAAKDLDLPLLIVVFTNHKYRSMQLNHLRFYPDGASVETGNFPGVDLSSQPELSDFAVPYGMHGEAVTEPAQLEGAIDRALEAVQAGRTAILNVHVAR
jgi:acetolactate synthase I/II/III large subunit